MYTYQEIATDCMACITTIVCNRETPAIIWQKLERGDIYHKPEHTTSRFTDAHKQANIKITAMNHYTIVTIEHEPRDLAYIVPLIAEHCKYENIISIHTMGHPDGGSFYQDFAASFSQQ